jgi:hypothetical protein
MASNILPLLVQRILTVSENEIFEKEILAQETCKTDNLCKIVARESDSSQGLKVP